jgi:hypothetical protein
MEAYSVDATRGTSSNAPQSCPAPSPETVAAWNRALAATGHGDAAHSAPPKHEDHHSGGGGLFGGLLGDAGDLFHSATHALSSGAKDLAHGVSDVVHTGADYAGHGLHALGDAASDVAHFTAKYGDRGLGVLQAGAGVAEVGVGVVGGILTSETGIGALVGGAVALHGLDDIQAGLRQAITGKPTETFTQEAATAVARRTGASPPVAAAIGVGIDIAASGGLGSGEKAAITGAEELSTLAKAGEDASKLDKGADAARDVMKGAEDEARGVDEASRAKGADDVAPTESKPYSDPKNRPAYGKGQVEEVWNNAKDEQGRVYDPNTGESLSWDRSKSRFGQWDMGHLPGQEYRTLYQRYMSGEIDLKQFLQEYRDAANYRPESPSANRSHLFEQK